MASAWSLTPGRHPECATWLLVTAFTGTHGPVSRVMCEATSFPAHSGGGGGLAPGLEAHSLAPCALGTQVASQDLRSPCLSGPQALLVAQLTQQPHTPLSHGVQIRVPTPRVLGALRLRLWVLLLALSRREQGGIHSGSGDRGRGGGGKGLATSAHSPLRALGTTAWKRLPLG